MLLAIIVVVAVAYCAALAWDTYLTVKRLPPARAPRRTVSLSNCVEARR